jgi:transcriptional regulator with XRE-family HTH domain
MKNLVFSERLRELRKSRGRTQQEIADLLNIRRSTYGEYERGVILPPTDKIQILAKYFNVTVDWLIGKEEMQEDISKTLNTLLTQLKSNKQFSFHGKKMNKESRNILIKSIESNLETMELLNRMNK